MGLWDELLLGAQHGEQEHCHKEPLHCCQDGSGFSVEGGFGEDDMARKAPRCSLRGMCEVWSRTDVHNSSDHCLTALPRGLASKSVLLAVPLRDQYEV
jgi:hypothetical protein